MSREALQAALLDAYAAMDAMEAQLTTLEHQLGVREPLREPLLATRGSCTQPLQPLPPPPLPLYTTTSASVPRETPLGAELSRPVARSSSVTASLTPTPPEEAATMALPTPILGSATSSISTTTKPMSQPARPAVGAVARPPPAIAFRSQSSGGFQPYSAASATQGCKRPAATMMERPVMVGCMLPAVGAACMGDAGQNDGPSIKRIRLTC